MLGIELVPGENTVRFATSLEMLAVQYESAVVRTEADGLYSDDVATLRRCDVARAPPYASGDPSGTLMTIRVWSSDCSAPAVKVSTARTT